MIIVLVIVRVNGDTLRYISKKYSDDIDIVLEAVLSIVSTNLRKNKNVVMTAIRNNGFALVSVAKKFHKDKNVLLTAVENNGLAL